MNGRTMGMGKGQGAGSGRGRGQGRGQGRGMCQAGGQAGSRAGGWGGAAMNASEVNQSEDEPIASGLETPGNAVVAGPLDGAGQPRRLLRRMCRRDGSCIDR